MNRGKCIQRWSKSNGRKKNQDSYWIQNPFKIKEKPKGSHSLDYENLIELSSDTQLEAKFRTVSLTIFWSYVLDEYPNLAKQAIRILLPFATTYLCEARFSKYVATKIKYRRNLMLHQIFSCCPCLIFDLIASLWLA
ncbi:zinc finger BED domain-containing protein 5 [Trichonephila clavata]|uniref:Zinc finger BED domain-containing protein 5 n=1 Tax=Trichonephila clavata TaxID=2740835 RepID=A0A8X6KU26_TRICU|nr:zinc finger BED domain-containing protein 5 [Trichonephila clavata]